jgi:hypothetical protein
MFHVEQWTVRFISCDKRQTFEFVFKTYDVPRGTLWVPHVRNFGLGMTAATFDVGGVPWKAEPSRRPKSQNRDMGHPPCVDTIVLSVGPEMNVLGVIRDLGS